MTFLKENQKKELLELAKQIDEEITHYIENEAVEEHYDPMLEMLTNFLLIFKNQQ